MKNRDIYQRDPSKITLLNNGVATMTDALTEDERRIVKARSGSGALELT